MTGRKLFCEAREEISPRKPPGVGATDAITGQLVRVGEAGGGQSHSSDDRALTFRITGAHAIPVTFKFGNTQEDRAPPPTMIQKYKIFPSSAHNCRLIVLNVLYKTHTPANSHWRRFRQEFSFALGRCFELGCRKTNWSRSPLCVRVPGSLGTWRENCLPSRLGPGGVGGSPRREGQRGDRTAGGPVAPREAPASLPWLLFGGGRRQALVI